MSSSVPIGIYIGSRTALTVHWLMDKGGGKGDTVALIRMNPVGTSCEKYK